VTNEVVLPALDGRVPLGFLAALGVLRLLTEHAEADVKLHFDEESAAAVVTGPYADLDAVVETLTGIATSGESLIPGLGSDFPIPQGRSGGDPMRLPRAGYRARWLADGEERRRWWSTLLTDLAVDDDGRVALTPYTAPSGRMTLRTFVEKPVTAVRENPETIREALVGWRRVEGFTGEYFDHQVLRSSAEDLLGRQGKERGVPGPTWLAVMALPLLRVTASGKAPTATLWHRLPHRRDPVMIWPLWRQPLDLWAVQALMEHPALRPIVTNGRVTVRKRDLDPLGVFLVCAGDRQRVLLRKFAGALAPIEVTLA
jgi:hypothetical protein